MSLLRRWKGKRLDPRKERVKSSKVSALSLHMPVRWANLFVLLRNSKKAEEGKQGVGFAKTGHR